MKDYVILNDEGYSFLKLNRDKTVDNLRTGHRYHTNYRDGALVIWWEGKSITIPVMRFWRKYFANEIEDVPEKDRFDLAAFDYPNYILTRDGRIWNKQFYTWQRTNVHKSTGYVVVNLTNPKGYVHMFKIHRLLMMAFKPAPNMNCLTVDHIDGNKENNSLDNLEWVTVSENSRRARELGLHFRTLTDDDVHKFCKEWSTGKYKTAGQCARAVGLKVTACEHILNHGAHTEIASQYGIEYKKPVRLTPIDWSRYPKSKYLHRPTDAKSSVRTPSNCEDELRAR